MTSELDRLLDRLDRRIAVGDVLSAAFARELAAVWRDAERALRQVIAEAQAAKMALGADARRGAVLLDRVRRILTQAGYDRFVTTAMSEAADRLIATALAGQDVRAAAARVQSMRATLNALREIATTDLLAVGDEISTALWRSLAQHLFTTRPIAEILLDLQDALDEDAATVRTLFDTQVSIYGRQVEASATEPLGPKQPFLYVGPIDDLTRGWCLARVGQVFTREAIDAMDNGQLPNPMLTGGGYNCRHTFMAVESQALRDMVGTGEVVAPVAADLKRIRDRKAARIAARKKAA